MKNLADNFREDFYTLNSLNEAARLEPKKLIRKSEKVFNHRVKNIVNYVTENKSHCKIILITGPSSSGKTTFSKILRRKFRRLGIWNDIISLDNFYKGIKSIPKLEDGSHDFESLEGLDIDGAKKVIIDLLAKGRCDIPLYDFKTMSATENTVHIEVPKSGIIIIEGLHAINPLITEGVVGSNILRIYIDANNMIKFENGEDFIKSENIRLMRRICRDYKYRHILPLRTVEMWKNVRRGEKLYVKPLKEYADFILNTFHYYEPCVMANDVVNFLNYLPKNLEMNDLKEKLSNFTNIDKDLVPKKSLIREFF